jgi:hypothetical protein
MESREVSAPDYEAERAAARLIPLLRCSQDCVAGENGFFWKDQSGVNAAQQAPIVEGVEVLFPFPDTAGCVAGGISFKLECAAAVVGARELL